MGEHLIADVESDGLIPEATKLHCIQCGVVESDEVTIYCDALPGFPSLAEGLARLSAAERLIGHNFLAFDMVLINKLYPGTIRREQVQDTLIMARLKTPDERSNSLDNWGQRLGILKGSFKGPWEVCTPEMIDYARQDVVVGRAVYNATKDTETWGESLALEHDVAYAMMLQEDNGWTFDEKAAQELDATLRGELAELGAELQALFPPLMRTATIIPKRNNKTRGMVAGVPFVSKEWREPFNPSSRQHVAERLQMAGWKPREFGKDGTPTVDEKTLAAMKFPAAKTIVRYFSAAKKIGMLSDGTNGWLKMVRNGKIHGRVNPCGAIGGRMAHSKPNVAQADSDPRMRALFTARPGWKLVGVDAKGLEARVLGHYLANYDGGSYSQRLLHGNEEEGTDEHSVNRDAIRAAGFAIDRPAAKTVLYAMVFGAGDWKLGTTVIESLREQGLPVPRVPAKEIGVLARRAVSRAMVGVDNLTTRLRTTAKERGYLIGLDGRQVVIRGEHSILNTLCQGGGAVVMKKAIQALFETEGHTHGTDWAIVGTIHDELQVEARPDFAEHIGQVIANCITLAGERLKLRCPHAGKVNIGDNWSETH